MIEDFKITFLNLQIMKDENDAHNAIRFYGNATKLYSTWLMNPWTLLAECKFKRDVINLHKQWPVILDMPDEMNLGSPDGNYIEGLTYSITRRMDIVTQQVYIDKFGRAAPTAPMINAMLQVYSDRPGFKEEWKIDTICRKHTLCKQTA